MLERVRELHPIIRNFSFHSLSSSATRTLTVRPKYVHLLMQTIFSFFLYLPHLPLSPATISTPFVTYALRPRTVEPTQDDHCSSRVTTSI